LHLLDFDEDLYGRDVTISFCAFLRDVERFDSIPGLVDAIKADCTAARRLFAGGGGACHSGPAGVSFNG